MADIERRGHRQRMRESFLSGGMEKAPDHNVLELYLSLVIPQKDVKQLTYDLINKFGSLDGVFNAPVEQLMEVKGIKEVSAVAISLVPLLSKRIAQNKNITGARLTSFDKCLEYCKNLVGFENSEAVYIITLNSDLTVINYYRVSDGFINSARVDFRMIYNNVTKDNASVVMVTHNHPTGSAQPSGADCDFTMQLKVFLRNIDVCLYDHIIIGKNSYYNFKSDSNMKRYLS